jgi:membrane protein required for colicin V production
VGAVNWLDAVIVLVVLWFTFSAFQAGFIRETVTIVAAILGVVLAGLFYEDLADDVLLFIEGDRLASIVAFGLIFAATALAGQMLAMVLKPTINLLQLGLFDQLAGAVFGFVKAMVFVQIFLIVFITFPKWGLREEIEDSTFGSLTAEMVDNLPVLVRMLPDEFETAVDDFTDKL